MDAGESGSSGVAHAGSGSPKAGDVDPRQTHSSSPKSRERGHGILNIFQIGSSTGTEAGMEVKEAHAGLEPGKIVPVLISSANGSFHQPQESLDASRQFHASAASAVAGTRTDCISLEPLPERPASPGSRRAGSVDFQRESMSVRRSATIQRYETVLRKDDMRPAAQLEDNTSNPLAAGVNAMLGVGGGSVPLHPNSMPRMGWDAFMLFVTIFALIADPISLAFNQTVEGAPLNFLDGADICVIIVFSIDITLNFLTGFIDTKEHRVIMHWRPVAIEYLKFWFLIDLVSTLPPEVWANNGQWGDTTGGRGSRVTKILRCLRISRLARSVQMLRLNYDLQISHFASKIGVRLPPPASLLAWSAICLLFLHWVSCLTCFVWTVSDSSYRQIGLVPDQDAEMVNGGSPECNRDAWCSFRFYIRGLRTASALMGGHGQFVGNSMPEDTAVFVFTMFGSVLYVSFTTVCASLMMEMDQERVFYFLQVDRLNHYMGRLQGGDQNEDILQYVSRSIRRDIAMHTDASLITGVPFLKGTWQRA
ncbi:hypothetical protein T484DRAFT_1851571 [Baffinella frigidus]|nr:hypothetical protein T484DRAFT_1851571 [Cryptophyta sp. CCMP2293]